MSTPQEIQKRINKIHAELALVNVELALLFAVRNDLVNRLLRATEQYQNAVNSEAIANEKAAAVATAEAIVSGVSE